MKQTASRISEECLRDGSYPASRQRLEAASKAMCPSMCSSCHPQWSGWGPSAPALAQHHIHRSSGSSEPVPLF